MNHKAETLARDILILSRNTLLVNLRFLDAAFSMFTLSPSELPLATDGRRLYFNCRHLLLQYKEETKAPVRDYLHLVMHCVFRHMYIHTLVDQPLWDLSCDIAVEEVINGLGLDCTASRRQSRQSAELDRLRKQLKLITAERVYHWYREHPPADPEALRELFWGDDHTPWYPRLQPQNTDSDSESGDEEQQSPADAASGSSSVELEETWEKIAQRMQMDLETFSKQAGDQAGTLTQNLRAVNREKYDYTAFLKRFAVRGEVMRLDPEEFDYIYYTYGLTLYGKMPLIEPLEYREVKRIREFVIAIDTSASTSGELVQRFIQKTYNILRSTESFFRKINLHIIQCDTEIQEDARIRSQEEFEEYLKSMAVKGLGGTDFRPVFAYVDRLRREKEFQNLRGLIYFTDGYGTFPEHKPAYDTAFVFVEDEGNRLDVPPWAIKLVLKKDEI